MKADKMFEKLGYKKTEDSFCIRYTKVIEMESAKRAYCFEFITTLECVEINKFAKEAEGKVYEIAPILTGPEIKAINKKIKELRW